MLNLIAPRIAAFGRIGVVTPTASAIIAGPFVRSLATGSYTLTEAQVEEQMNRDKAAANAREARKAEIAALPVEQQEQLLAERSAKRYAHMQELKAIKTVERVPLDHLVQKYRASALAGPNYRGSAVKQIMNTPWYRIFDFAKDQPDNRLSVGKEKVDAAHMRLLRFAKFTEIDLDGKWDGDLDGDWPNHVGERRPST